MGNQTQEYLLGAIERLLNKKSLEEISVTELTAVAGISRMTFYRHYRNVNDILLLEMDRLAEELLKKVDFERTNHFDGTVRMMEFVKEHSDFILILARANQQNILRDTIARMSMGYSRDKPALKNYNDREIDYFVKYHAAGLTSVIVEWIVQNQPETPEQLAVFVEKIINDASLDRE